MDTAILMSVVMGAIGVPLIQFIKAKTGIDGKPAQWLALGVSALLAVAVYFMSGGVLDVNDPAQAGTAIIGILTTIFTLTQVGYRQVYKD